MSFQNRPFTAPLGPQVQKTRHHCAVPRRLRGLGRNRPSGWLLIQLKSIGTGATVPPGGSWHVLYDRRDGSDWTGSFETTVHRRGQLLGVAQGLVRVQTPIWTLRLTLVRGCVAACSQDLVHCTQSPTQPPSKPRRPRQHFLSVSRESKQIISHLSTAHINYPWVFWRSEELEHSLPRHPE